VLGLKINKNLSRVANIKAEILLNKYLTRMSAINSLCAKSQFQLQDVKKPAL